MLVQLHSTICSHYKRRLAREKQVEVALLEKSDLS